MLSSGLAVVVGIFLVLVYCRIELSGACDGYGLDARSYLFTACTIGHYHRSAFDNKHCVSCARGLYNNNTFAKGSQGRIIIGLEVKLI